MRHKRVVTPSRLKVSIVFLGVAVALLPLADLSLTGRDPWGELGRLGLGLITPDISAIESILTALALTLAIAIAGVALGASVGLVLAPFYHRPIVRLGAIGVRSIHEIFWALLLLNVTGLGATTGILAIALPYCGIFAKVYAEHLEEADPRPRQVLDRTVSDLSAFLYARLPLALSPIRIYTLYRLECGIRSSAVLGFVGLATLGFQLDTVFKQGQYSAVGAILLIYFVVIGTVRWWMRWHLTPLYILGSLVCLIALDHPPPGGGSLLTFLTHDIVPAPLRSGALGAPETWHALAEWSGRLFSTQALPGLIDTLIVAQLALILTGLVAIMGFPLIVPRVSGRLGAIVGHLGLVVGRSTPEYMLAYILLQVCGPSMLPAILALGLHNGAIIAHLLGRQAVAMDASLRRDAPRGVNLYAYELVPRLYGSFTALCLYRWEIIMRESAIIGMLGIATLGFYIDSAVSELRLDRVVFFLLVTAAATLIVDWLSRYLRSRMGLHHLQIATSPKAP